jgi:hypothetical protein
MALKFVLFWKKFFFLLLFSFYIGRHGRWRNCSDLPRKKCCLGVEWRILIVKRFFVLDHWGPPRTWLWYFVWIIQRKKSTRRISLKPKTKQKKKKFWNLNSFSSFHHWIAPYITFHSFLKLLNIVSAFDGISAALAEVGVILRTGQAQLLCNI